MIELLRAVIGPDKGDASPLQLCARAIIIFAVGIVCIRIAGRRTFAQATPLDIIVALIVGSNLSRVMTGKASFLGGIAATLVFVLLHRGLAMATLHWSPLASLLKCGSIPLVRGGVPDEAAMRRHGISRDDLMAALRMEQVDRTERVKLASLEAGGKISVVKAEA